VTVPCVKLKGAQKRACIKYVQTSCREFYPLRGKEFGQCIAIGLRGVHPGKSADEHGKGRSSLASSHATGHGSPHSSGGQSSSVSSQGGQSSSEQHGNSDHSAHGQSDSHGGGKH
jgi:hypothetical protein